MPDYPLLSDASIITFLDDIPEMCFIYRDDGLLMALNTTCERLFGVPRAAAIGRFNVFQNKELISPELVEGYHRAFRGESVVIPVSKIDLARPNDIGLEINTPVRWVETLLIPLLKRDDGSAPYVVGIQGDVTELMKMREDIEAAQRRISAQRDTIESLEAARREIEAQKSTIQALSTPVIEVWDGIVTLPLLGHFNAERANAMTAKLLEAVVRTRARYAILDLTGVGLIDATTGDHILQIIGAVALLGTTGVLVGIQPEIAQTLVSLGVDLSRIRVYQNLRQALKACMREAGAG
jgi:anti-anti-sigma regulatory factor